MEELLFSSLSKLSVYKPKMIRFILFKKRNAGMQTDSNKHNVLSFRVVFLRLNQICITKATKELF